MYSPSFFPASSAPQASASSNGLPLTPEDQGHQGIGRSRGRRGENGGERAGRGEYGATDSMRNAVHKLLLIKLLGTSRAGELIVS
jgi:hypothetical protein